ncbi:CoA transferase [Actinomadura sp. KC345]|uniref:CoA transferase n=1 Tax=Actinomadura sp. KC345 TaxID=2530371 RepID=UPI001053A5D0|nr:CoA transferase [Actinomadura sp. KC345]TDC48474.1 CoA transferase [Actinomadura sp. KC345]
MPPGEDEASRVSGPDPLLTWAASGVPLLCGHPAGPPLVPPGSAAAAAAGLGERFGVDGARLLSERAAFTGHRRGGRTSAGGACRLLPTADGWAAVSCARPDDPALLGALAGARVNDDPWPVVAPWLRGHTGAELAERAALLGIAAGPVQAAPASPRVPRPLSPRPLKDALVVDFSALWAGPLCAHLLGLAGARVVKVETPGRPDGARRGDAGFYDLLHAGHRSVVLDPAVPAGRRALAALVDAADIVIEASRPRALARFGLDAGAAVAAGTTWVSITAYGRDEDRVGFGDDVAAAGGLVCRDGDGAPLFCGDAIADPLTGLTAAGLAATAPPDGAGVLWDVSMRDVVAATLPPGDPSPSPSAVRHGDAWLIETGDGAVPVTGPARRRPSGAAPAMGRHTAEVLTALGIPVP